jgi:hypothetical protein
MRALAATTAPFQAMTTYVQTIAVKGFPHRLRGAAFAVALNLVH